MNQEARERVVAVGSARGWQRRPWGLLCVAAIAWSPALAQPAEVGNLRFLDKQTLAWDPEPLAEHYNVYRAYLFELPRHYGTAIAPEVPETTAQDPADPLPGQGFAYLVTAYAAGAEGPMGDRVEGGVPTHRPNLYPWPGFAVAGRWELQRTWPVVAIHAALLHTGKVLTWAGGGSPTQTFLWDPASDTFTTQQVNTNLFCSGHAFLADGKLFVAGGTIPLFNGRMTTFIFDPLAESWQQGPLMLRGRYYPSLLTQGDGTVLLFSGNDEEGRINPRVEVYDPKGQGSIEVIPGADRAMIIYPAMHLLPEGRIFHVGPEAATETFDPQAVQWSDVDTTNYGQRGGGSGNFNSVMLPPGFTRVMILGGVAPGADRSTESVEIIDMAEPSPQWRLAASLHFPRNHANAVILPDGTVLVAGGGYDEATPVHAAEIFDPRTETWTVGATMRGVFRLYHSTGLLLPDGRVMWAGGTNPASNPTAEFYLPPYVFRGPRPVIASAPAWVRYGRSFTIDTPDAARIASVVWIRPGAVTHSRDMSQRYVPLAFTAGAGSIQAVAPGSPHEAPPGYYMLFLVDSDGVPSEARFMQLR